jgi:membrane associated rhomboid family serine protease
MLIPIGDDVNRRTLPFVTIGLVAMNVLVFFLQCRVAMDSGESGEEYAAFIRSWGLTPVDFFDGQYTGLFACMFLHGGLGHLLGNMFTLWLFGPTLEAALGSVRYLLFYLWWGIVAGLTQALVDPTSEIPMIGASGAISGAIGGYFVTFGPLACIRLGFYGGFLTGFQWIKFKIPASAYVFFWIIIPQLLGLSDSLESGETHVAWYAHIGGFLAGMFALRFLAWDARRRLIFNCDGQLEIEARAGNGNGARFRLAKVELSQCPYCQTPLDDSNRLDETMYRCPGDGCQRLIFFSPTPLQKSG